NDFSLIGIEAHNAPDDAKLLITRQRADLIGCESIKLFGIKANRDRACRPITSSLSEHVLKLRNERELVAILGAGEGIPSVTILHRAPCGVGRGASDDDWRYGFCTGFGLESMGPNSTNLPWYSALAQPTREHGT